FTTITLLGLAAAVAIVVDDVITDINTASRITAEGEAPVRAAFSAVRGPLVLAFALAVLASMVVSFLLTPTLGVLLLRGPKGRDARRPGPLVRGTRRIFDRGLAAIARPHRAWALAGVLALALLAIIPQTGGNSSLLPALQDRNLLLHVEAAPGTSLIEMDRITATAGTSCRPCPE